VSEPSKASRKLFAERLSRTTKKTVKKAGLIARLRKQADIYKGTVDVQNNKIVEMDKKIDSQNEIIQQQNAKIAEQTEKIAEIHRRLIGSDIFHALLKEPKKDEDCSGSGRKRSIESLEDQDSKRLKIS
jgi:Cu2+-containing amine oxidase